MKWHEMTYVQRREFCEKYGFDFHSNHTPAQSARNDRDWLRDCGTEGIDSIGFYREPLLELGEYELWQALEWAYNQALKQEAVR